MLSPLVVRAPVGERAGPDELALAVRLQVVAPQAQLRHRGAAPGGARDLHGQLRDVALTSVAGEAGELRDCDALTGGPVDGDERPVGGAADDGAHRACLTA